VVFAVGICSLMMARDGCTQSITPVLSAQSAEATSSETALRPADRQNGPEVTLVLRDVTRAESWSFFEPPAGGGDPSYSLLGNRATLGARAKGRRFEGYGAFQYAQLVGLPRFAVGPGGLGPGAFYYDAARASGAYQLYFKALSLRVNDLAPGLSIEAGRMGFSSGDESRSPSPELEALKRDRVSGRLIGEAEWTPFERAFDGVRIDLNRSRWHVNGALFFPTQGAFEESANPTIGRVRVITTALSRRAASAAASRPAEVQVFANHYRDGRAIRTRPDNSGRAAIAVDIHVATVGASWVGMGPLRDGRWDAVLWAARQFGDWYGDAHGALSVIAEGGYRWQSAWHPWLRAGTLFASGDDSAADARHGTFVPLLPTTKPSLLAGTFAQMNSRDLFAELRLTPIDRLALASSVHRLGLARSTDRWYSGTGATAIRGAYFGFSSRSSNGATTLATVIETSAQATMSRRWSLVGSVGIARGGEVVRRLFAGRRLTVLALESVLAF
jgi:Alginate export